MKKLSLLLFTLPASMVGILLACYGLVRLGWRRHGSSWWDLGFLHLDWLFQPSLPYRQSHVENFAVFLAGVILLLGSVLVAVVVGLRWRNHRVYAPASSQETPT